MKPRNIAIAWRCRGSRRRPCRCHRYRLPQANQVRPRQLKRLTGYADSYDLYAIDIAYDYDLDRIIAAGVRDDQGYIDAVWRRCCPVCRYMSRRPSLPGALLSP